MGYLQDQLAALAWALAAFATDLDDRMTEVTVTEFGRAVAENANGGVDHGGGQGTLMHGKGRCGGGRHVHGAGPASHPVVPDVPAVRTLSYTPTLARVLARGLARGLARIE